METAEDLTTTTEPEDQSNDKTDATELCEWTEEDLTTTTEQADQSNDKAEFNCEICNFGSKYKYSLKRHYEKIHGITKQPHKGKLKQDIVQAGFSCEMYEYQAKNKYNVDRHKIKWH